MGRILESEYNHFVRDNEEALRKLMDKWHEDNFPNSSFLEKNAKGIQVPSGRKPDPAIQEQYLMDEVVDRNAGGVTAMFDLAGMTHASKGKPTALERIYADWGLTPAVAKLTSDKYMEAAQAQLEVLVKEMGFKGKITKMGIQ